MRRKRVYIRVNKDLISWIREQVQEVNRTTSNFIEYVLILYKKGKTRNEAQEAK